MTTQVSHLLVLICSENRHADTPYNDDQRGSNNEEEMRLNLDLLQKRIEATTIHEARVRPVSFRVGDYVSRKNKASRVEDLGKLGSYLLNLVSDNNFLTQCNSQGSEHKEPNENSSQNIHEELADYINTPSWNRHAFYNYDNDDDEDYTIAIIPILSTEEPDNSLNQFEDFSDSNDDSTLIDDDYFSIDDIDYVEASPPHSELVSSGEVKDFHPKDGEIEDDILCKKLLNIHLLIAKIESLNDNPTPDRVLNDHMEEKNSGSTTIHVDISLLNFDHFHFKIEPDLGELTSIVDFGIRKNFLSATNVNLSPEDDQSPLFAYVVWIFLSFLTYLVAPPLIEFKTFSDHMEEKNSGSTTIHVDISLLNFDHFHFKIEPDLGELTSIVDFGIRKNFLSATNVNLSPEDDQSPLFAYVVWIF
nr:reverse transcriptase domain-containing protein [Tanacetum cinerariifolium]